MFLYCKDQHASLELSDSENFYMHKTLNPWETSQLNWDGIVCDVYIYIYIYMSFSDDLAKIEIAVLCRLILNNARFYDII